MAEVWISQSGVLVEIESTDVRASQAGVLAEIASTDIRISQAGALAEIVDTRRFVSLFGVLAEIQIIPQDGVVPTLEHATVTYGGIDITEHLTGAVLDALIRAVDTTNFDSDDDGEKTAGPSTWKVDVTGLWSPTLDDIFAPDVIEPPAASELKTCSLTFGWPTNTVSYTWANNAFVQRYQVEADVDDVMQWTGSLALSGSPVRTGPA